MIWAGAVIVTLLLAFFQRATGPTHPAHVRFRLEGGTFAARLPRSHGGPGGLAIELPVGGRGVSGLVRWRRFPGGGAWQSVPLHAGARGLEAELPHQPPAGKIEYHVVLRARGGRSVVIPGRRSVVARFKGAVPPAVLLPHILCMFLSMLFATRAAFAVFWEHRVVRSSVLAAAAFLVVGGLILGPFVQRFAFGAYWTGWPYGTDLTDNKTLIAFLGWLPATLLALRRRQRAGWVAGGWLVMMAVFLIPHSLHGSQIDWSSRPSPTSPPLGSHTESAQRSSRIAAAGAPRAILGG